VSAEPIPIYEGQDFYVPTFEVRLQKRPLAKEVVRDIVQVSYKDSLDDIDSFELSINNWDAATRTFKYSDSDLFDPGKQLELWLGYFGRDRQRLMMVGEITSLRPSFPAGGQPMLAVSALNLLHRFRRQQESTAYEAMTDSDIAREIANRLDIDVRTDPEAEENEQEYEYVFQDNQYDIVFLMERARRIGYDLFVEESAEDGRAEDGKLYFGPSLGVRDRTYTLTYGKSLVEFQPELTTANQVAEVTVRGWNPVDKQKIEVTVKRSELRTTGVGQRGGQAAIEQSYNQKKEVVATRPVRDEAEARVLARETLERIAKDLVKATGTTVGLPDLRAGTVLVVDGIGERFRGRYFVTATTHALGDGGYTTQFECRREETEEN
jgi:phage protein D